jgi:hypothetical protein
MWARLRSFFRGLYNLVGIPTENADAAIFIRNQKRTGWSSCWAANLIKKTF